ncbi:MAG: DUF4832 domain-containing protein [Bacteroidetes bacterium]|nr:DUF4832 domain-containing protein [Bacteroidota bacterium]
MITFPISFAFTQEKPVIKIAKPVEINDIISNPGIGFTTGFSFNGDGLSGEKGYYPESRIAYFGFYWNKLEPGPEQYDWSAVDKVLNEAAKHNQTVIIRITPYRTTGTDVPDWYREMAGPEPNLQLKKWRTDPNNPRYAYYYGNLIRAFGKHFDGHPWIEAVDVSLVGSCGEGAGSHLLSDDVRITIINAYLDGFKKTHLIFQPLNGDNPDPGLLVKNTNITASWPDESNNGTGPQMRNVGWRGDCLGDMGFWPELHQDHMTDFYPLDIVNSGMSEAWKKAPVTMEICGTFQRWLEKEKYSYDTVKYIFDQAVKWHVSSFNGKSTAVPDIWVPLVKEWLNKMGYRFVLRRFTYPAVVNVNGQLPITTWWENKGNAPIYRDYKFVVRLINSERSEIYCTNAYLPNWLPGDNVHSQTFYIPYDMPAGDYRIEVAVVTPVTFKPSVKLAIAGVNEDGWYPMGEIKVQKN